MIGVFKPVASGEYNFEIQSSGEAQMWFGSDAEEGEEEGSQHNTTVSVPFWAGTRGFDGNLAWSSELGDRDVGQMSATQSLQAYTSYPIKVRVSEGRPLPTFHPVNVSDPCRNASAIPAVSERCIPHADGQSGANVSNVTCALTAEPLNTTTCLSALASLVNTSGDEAYPIQRNTTAESPQGAAYMSAAYCNDWQSFISSSNAIGDGGNGTYDIGNLITTSLMGGAVGNCSSDPGHNCSLGSLQYRSDFEQVPTNCFGRGGYYQMAQLDEMWVFFTTVTHNSSIDFMIRGNLGSDGGSAVTEYVFLDATPFVGFVKRVCGGANPSVNHLTIVSLMCGDRCDGDEGLPAHTCDVTSAGNSSLGNCTGADPDLDDDRLSGILPGSPILYLLYSTTNGSCMKEEDHHRMFEAAALCLLQASSQIEPCTVTAGSGSCEYVPAFGGVSLEDACTASSDMPGQCVYTPAGQSNIAGSANETCTEGPSHVRRICAAACIAHGYDHVGLRSNNAACFCADDDDYRAGGQAQECSRDGLAVYAASDSCSNRYESWDSGEWTTAGTDREFTLYKIPARLPTGDLRQFVVDTCQRLGLAAAACGSEANQSAMCDDNHTGCSAMPADWGCQMDDDIHRETNWENFVTLRDTGWEEEDGDPSNVYGYFAHTFTSGSDLESLAASFDPTDFRHQSARFLFLKPCARAKIVRLSVISANSIALASGNITRSPSAKSHKRASILRSRSPL